MNKRICVMLLLFSISMTMTGCTAQVQSKLIEKKHSTANETVYGMEAAAPKAMIVEAKQKNDQTEMLKEQMSEKNQTEIQKIDQTELQEITGQEKKNPETMKQKTEVREEELSETDRMVIGEEQAKQYALQAAGVKETEIKNLYIVRKWDDGYDVYDVEFKVNYREYDYDIDVYSGEIRSFDHDMESEQIGWSAGMNQDKELQPNRNNSDTGVSISENEAVALVLERVPGAGSEHVYIQLERDDGHWMYDGEIYYNGKEFEFEMNAESGQILEWSEEEDD